MSTKRTTDMTAGASGALPVPNIKDWGCEPATVFNEDNAQVSVKVDFYLAGLPNPYAFVVSVANGESTKLSRNLAATGFSDLIVASTVATPTGFTDALAGWKGGNTKNQRQKGLADALLAAGIIDASLGGTTS
jgi:hypothetical protein